MAPIRHIARCEGTYRVPVLPDSGPIERSAAKAGDPGDRTPPNGPLTPDAPTDLLPLRSTEMKVTPASGGRGSGPAGRRGRFGERRDGHLVVGSVAGGVVD